MFCPRCGKEIRAESRFCAYCGARIAAMAQPRSSTQRAPSAYYPPPQRAPAAQGMVAYPQAAPPAPVPEAYGQGAPASPGSQAYPQAAQLTPEQKKSAILWLMVIIGVMVISVIALIVLLPLAKGGGKTCRGAAKPAVEAGAETGNTEMEAGAETVINEAGEEEEQDSKGAFYVNQAETVNLPVDSEEEAVALVMRDPYVRDRYANSSNAQVEAATKAPIAWCTSSRSCKTTPREAIPPPAAGTPSTSSPEKSPTC